MIALIGYLGILVALGAAVKLAIDGIRLARRPAFDAAGLRRDALILLIGAAVAFLALEGAILAHEFSIEYVADNTARTTPFVFLLASGWAALEGSIVLWGIVLAGFAYLVGRQVGTNDGLGAGALAVIGLVAIFWFGLMATAANPFRICTEVIEGVCAASTWLPVGSAVAPLEGAGPNPLLQNHILMAIHPPMLYVGYVGFTIPYAFAMSAMWRGDQGSVWLERTHRWSVVAWTFLTFGIILGGWWSYEVLGWGGYWAWDPVENAAILPWLIGTAFLHSAVVQRRRGMLQAWNLVLVISTFALTIFGTFLTRSGTIFSVHSFTQSPVGPTLLVFLGIVLVGSFGLFAWRSHLVASAPRLESLASREGVFLANNLLLTLFAFTVLVGTMYPLILEAFAGREVTVGRPFFDRATIPIAFALLLAMGIGPVTPYRVARPEVVWKRIRSPLTVGLFAGALAVVAGVWSVAVVIVVVLGTFVISVIVRALWVRWRAGRGTADGGTSVWRIVRSDPGYWGGQLAHVGVALMAIAIAASSALAVRNEVRLEVGQAAVVDDYCLVYDGPVNRTEPNRIVQGVAVRVLRADCSTEVASLQPRVNVYNNSSQPVATPAVHTGLTEDVYLSIAGGGADAVTLDVFVFPLMWMLWAGGLITVAGGAWSLLAVKPKRRVMSAAAPASEDVDV